MRKLTMGALISTLALSFGATAAFAGAPEMDRCNGGPPLAAEDRGTASAPRSPSVAGVNLGCLAGTDQANYNRDSRHSLRDMMDHHRDAKRQDSSRSNY